MSTFTKLVIAWIAIDYVADGVQNLVEAARKSRK